MSTAAKQKTLSQLIDEKKKIEGEITKARAYTLKEYIKKLKQALKAYNKVAIQIGLRKKELVEVGEEEKSKGTTKKKAKKAVSLTIEQQEAVDNEIKKAGGKTIEVKKLKQLTSLDGKIISAAISKLVAGGTVERTGKGGYSPVKWIGK